MPESAGGGGECFPADGIVTLKDGTNVSLSALTVGDIILIPSSAGTSFISLRLWSS